MGHRGLVGLFVIKLIQCQGSSDRIPVFLLFLFVYRLMYNSFIVSICLACFFVIYVDLKRLSTRAWRIEEEKPAGVPGMDSRKDGSVRFEVA